MLEAETQYDRNEQSQGTGTESEEVEMIERVRHW